MAVEILVAQSEPKGPLPKQILDRVLDLIRIPGIVEAGGEVPQEAAEVVHLPQQHRATVRGDRPAIKGRHDLAPPRGLKEVLLRGTVCVREPSPFVLLSRSGQTTYSTNGRLFLSIR